ncbi:hypothetical protein [Butyrivibrio sp. MC2013]|uniref:hypothetical protein n=1 Tax=Butyrivibrio sp. MC2013 TaxID=1280686 RepID=UPI00047E5EE4|nr:hypothetical protein [Butyrivibrio sp. MC2013]
MNKRIILFMTCFLIAAFALVFFIYSQREAQKSVVGTYCSGDEKSEETYYLAIQSDDRFVLYRQLREAYYGNAVFDYEEDKVVLKLSDDDGNKYQGVFDNYDTVILTEGILGDEELPLEFKRISDTPILVNVLTDEE